MNALEKLRKDMLALIQSHDPAKQLEDMGYSRDRAKALAKTRGIETARSLDDKKR